MKLEEVQQLVKQRIERANTEQRLLDHILFCGPYNLTREVLSTVSKQTQFKVRFLEAKTIPRQGDLAAILTHLKPGSIVWINEIHRLETIVVPMISSAMKDFMLDFVVGKAPQGKNIRLNLPQFTALATTTRLSLLSYQLHTLFPVEYEISP